MYRRIFNVGQIVASELNDPICHSNECQIGSFSSEATRCVLDVDLPMLSMKASSRRTCRQMDHPLCKLNCSVATCFKCVVQDG